MLYKAKEIVKRNWFNICCRGILSTPPIQPKKSDLVIISMVSHVDLLMYLVAIKSLYYYINDGAMVILNDSTLTEQDIILLRRHLSPSAIFNINDIDTGKCPKGGTWERLSLVARYVQNHYVMQIDSDTVTSGNIPEVIRCLKDKRSFILGTEPGQDFQPVQKICNRMKSEDESHIQVVSEKNLDKLKNSDKLRYARTCSGFAGFVKGSFSWSDVEVFSQQMGEIVGDKWREWGSEQVASAFVIANLPNAEVLSYPKYASYYPHLDVDYDSSSFLHFIGKNRFENNLYVKKVHEVIRSR